MDLMELKLEPGWRGMFTRAQAEGAMPNGTRIVKADGEPGDGHPIGSTGTVLGSVTVPPEIRAEFRDTAFFYFIEWDIHPKVAVGLLGWKIKEEAST